MLRTDVVIGAALIYSKEKLTGVNAVRLLCKAGMLRLAPAKPAGSAGNGPFHIIPRRRVFYTFVKRHGNIRAKGALNLH